MIDNFISVTGFVFGVLAGLAFVAYRVVRMFYIGFFIAIVRMTLAK